MLFLALLLILAILIYLLVVDTRARLAARAMAPTPVRLVDIDAERKVVRRSRATKVKYIVRLLFEGPQADMLEHRKSFSFQFTADRWLNRFAIGQVIPVKPNIARRGGVFLPGEENHLDYLLILGTLAMVGLTVLALIDRW